MHQGRQQQEPTEATQARLYALPERRRNPRPFRLKAANRGFEGGEDVKASFFQDKRKVWQPGFTVSRPGNFPYRVTIGPTPFSGAWRKAVNTWAEAHEILDEDKARVLDSRPEPAQFKRLRRRMNDHDGFDIPVEALDPVFREQRFQLASQRAMAKIENNARPASSMRSAPESVEEEVAAWFDREVGQTT